MKSFTTLRNATVRASLCVGLRALLAAGTLAGLATAALPFESHAQTLRTRRADADLGTRDLGIRYLKLGNTYRETRNYDLAQLYVKKGLDMVRNRGSRYWEAVGYEYLGLVYRDMGERDLALEYLRVAQNIFASILNTRDGVGSDEALKLLISDIERGYDRVPARPGNVEFYAPTAEADRLRSENARLQDVNRQLSNRIADLEDRIRRLEFDAVNRGSMNLPTPNTNTLLPSPDISECKRDIESIARYRESILWSNNYTPLNLQVVGARVSDANTKVNGTIITGYLRKGESVKVEVDVAPGLYAIVADGCVNKARDIDVRIINQRGVVLEKKDIRFTTNADVSVEGSRVNDARTSERDARVTEERNPSSTSNSSSAQSTSATTSSDYNADRRIRPSSTREPLAKLSWNAEYAGTHTFLVTMYDSEPEGAYFCLVIGRR